MRGAWMAAKRATHAHPIRGGDQGLPGHPEPGVPPLVPPSTTIIIGDPNAAPTDDDRTGPPTATDIAVRDAMHQLGLTDLTAGLTGTSSHYPHQAGTHPSRIDTCYGDPTTVRVHEATYGDLPPTGTGHQPLYIDFIIPNLPPPAATLLDDTLQPTLQFPAEDDHGAWHRYNRALHAILRHPDAPALTIAMRRAAQACGMERDTSHMGAPPDLTLQQLVHDIWTTKEELATLLHPSTPEARDRDVHLRALLTTRRHQLQEWHAHRIAAAAQERERYDRNDTPYKSLRFVSRILEETGRRTIHAVRIPEGGLTNDPDAILQAVLESFQAQGRDTLPELDPHTRSTIREHVPRVFNREQRRAIEHDPFSISELQRALDSLRKGVVPGVDGLPAEAYQRLTLPVKRSLAARPWDIVTGATPIPPEWANLPCRWQHYCASPVMKCDIGHLHTPCTRNPNFQFTLFFGVFWVPLNIPWHIPLVYYDPPSHMPQRCFPYPCNSPPRNSQMRGLCNRPLAQPTPWTCHPNHRDRASTFFL